MNARVVTVQSKPDKVEEAVSLWRDEVLPIAKQQQGFKGVLLLLDRGTGKTISISLWESEADMKAGESSGYFQAQLAKFVPLFAGQPAREHYEVGLQA